MRSSTHLEMSSTEAACGTSSPDRRSSSLISGSRNEKWSRYILLASSRFHHATSHFSVAPPLISSVDVSTAVASFTNLLSEPLSDLPQKRYSTCHFIATLHHFPSWNVCNSLSCIEGESDTCAKYCLRPGSLVWKHIHPAPNSAPLSPWHFLTSSCQHISTVSVECHCGAELLLPGKPPRASCSPLEGLLEPLAAVRGRRQGVTLDNHHFIRERLKELLHSHWRTV